MIYLISDISKAQLFKTASNEDFSVEVMGTSYLLVVKKGDLDSVFRRVKEKTGVVLQFNTSSLTYLSDSDDITDLSIDQMATLSVSGGAQIVVDSEKQLSFDEFNSEALNIFAALSLVDDSGVSIDYDKKLVTIDSNAALNLETVLTKEVSTKETEIKDDNGITVGTKTVTTEKFVPVKIPLDDVVQNAQNKEYLDPMASTMITLDGQSKNDWYKWIIAGVAGTTGLIVLALFLSGLIQDFAASKIRKGSVNKLFVKLASMGSLRHRKSGGIVLKQSDDADSIEPCNIESLFYNVNVIKAVNIIGLGATSGAIAHYEPIIDFGFEHGLFMIHTPAISYVVVSYDQTEQRVSLYDSSNDGVIADGLYSGYLKPDVNNIFNG